MTGGALYVDDTAQRAAHAGDLAGLLALRPRAHHVARRRQGPRRARGGGRPHGRGHPGREQRRHRAARRAAVREGRSPLSRARSSLSSSATRSRNAGGPPRWWRWTTSLCRRFSVSPRRSRGAATSPSARAAQGRLRRRARGGAAAARGRVRIGRPGAFLPRDACRLGRAGERRHVFVGSSTQHPSEIQTIVAEVLGVPRNMVVVQAPRMGGGFGGKEVQGNAFAALVALAAAADREGRADAARPRPRHDDHRQAPSFPFLVLGRLRRGGRLLAARVELVSDGGWSLDLSQPIMDRALFHLDNVYYIPAVDFSGRVRERTTTSHTAFRGFGGPQAMLVIEEIVDRVARRLGLPPENVRAREPLPRHRRDEHDPLRPGDRRQPAERDVGASPGAGGLRRRGAAPSTRGTQSTPASSAASPSPRKNSGSPSPGPRTTRAGPWSSSTRTAASR